MDRRASTTVFCFFGIGATGQPELWVDGQSRFALGKAAPLSRAMFKSVRSVGYSVGNDRVDYLVLDPSQLRWVLFH